MMSSHFTKNKSACNCSHITNPNHNVAKDAALTKEDGHQTKSHENTNVEWKIAIGGKKFECWRSICLTICCSLCLLMLFVFSATSFDRAYNSGKKLTQIILAVAV